MVQAKILIVDDEHLIRWSICRRLQSDGFDVLEAATADEARRYLSKDAPDAVVLDHKLPDADGLGLLKEIRKLTGVPVIMVTAHSSIDHAVAAMRDGAFHYAGKPFDLEELTSLIKAALAARFAPEADCGVSLPARGVDIRTVERSLLEQALIRCNFNRTHAARLLGINRDQVRYRIERFGIEEAKLRGQSVPPPPQGDPS